MLEKKLKGAWIIHHAQKLSEIKYTDNTFDNTLTAGKAGLLLSSLSKDEEAEISSSKVQALSTYVGISSLERKPLLDLLKEKELIDYSRSGDVVTLGLTQHSILEHTASIFDQNSNPYNLENASIFLAEKASQEPVFQKEMGTLLADEFKLSTTNLEYLFSSAETIGFTDVEILADKGKLLFNGNLFKRQYSEKIGKVFQSLTVDESAKINELNDIIRSEGCVSINEGVRVLGQKLLDKLLPIGVYEVNIVSNSREEIGFLTLPESFSKFGSNSIVDDTFDLAKAFISSLKYGMTRSAYARGQIQAIEPLLRKLIAGGQVGPVTAIGQDYKVLELKGVVQVIPYANGRFYLKLLKREVGEIALLVLTSGNASEHALIGDHIIPSTAATEFSGPEVNRDFLRKKQVKANPTTTNNMLDALRTGGI
ncbi:hypothetical protein R4641_15940 [Acinetobacter baumannii]|uniref:hypothetical protein n=1 Tax=Acinetobacter baumannii TaxID=470 RepID=UPI002957B651|nr:hypothetical protein [Acinetobacter baumannii]MDV7609604.1 hypothetical protein [Acinetobacter baumannii]MDV7611395.1 hypothetical protein [Acinetobacter baumannii]MDV7615540.1 hypothetical protein [Acinetobacter baumannii]